MSYRALPTREARRKFRDAESARLFPMPEGAIELLSAVSPPTELPANRFHRLSTTLKEIAEIITGCSWMGIASVYEKSPHLFESAADNIMRKADEALSMTNAAATELAATSYGDLAARIRLTLVKVNRRMEPIENNILANLCRMRAEPVEAEHFMQMYREAKNEVCTDLEYLSFAVEAVGSTSPLIEAETDDYISPAEAFNGLGEKDYKLYHKLIRANSVRTTKHGKGKGSLWVHRGDWEKAVKVYRSTATAPVQPRKPMQQWVCHCGCGDVVESANRPKKKCSHGRDAWCREKY